jgi:hypothetical protein
MNLAEQLISAYLGEGRRAKRITRNGYDAVKYWSVSHKKWLLATTAYDLSDEDYAALSEPDQEIVDELPRGEGERDVSRRFGMAAYF